MINQPQIVLGPGNISDVVLRGNLAVDPLWEIDGRAGPQTQTWPQTTAAITALGLPAPSAIFDFEEASGSIIDHIGVVNLTATGAKQNQDASGLYNGSSWTYKKALEFAHNTDSYAEANAATSFNLGATDSLAIMGIVRADYRNTLVTLLSKQQTSTADGYRIDLTTGGTIRGWVDSGLITQNSIVAGNFGRGGWHCFLFVIDRNANIMQMHTEYGSGPSRDISSLGSMSNGIKFRLGGGTGHAYNSAFSQYAYAVVWEGANAQGMGAADIPKLFKHHIINDVISSEPIDTISHNDTISTVVVNAESGFGDRLADWGINQPVFKAYSGLSHDSKLALFSSIDSITALITDSDRLDQAGWTATNVTVSGSAADLNVSPRGMTEAYKLTATGNNGTVHDVFTTVNTTIYTLCVFVKRHSTMATNVAGALIFYDEIGTAAISTQTFTATDEWQMITITAAAVSNSSSLRIRIDTSGEILTAFRAQCVASAFVWPQHTRQSVSGGGTGGVTYEGISTAAGDWIKGGKGEIDCTYICEIDNDSDERYIFDTDDNGNADKDRRSLYITTAEKIEGEVFDKDGASDHTVTASSANTQNQENRAQFQWNSDSATLNGKYSQVIINSTKTGGAASGWTSEDNSKSLFLGADNAGAKGLNGGIARIRIFEEAQ